MCLKKKREKEKFKHGMEFTKGQQWKPAGTQLFFPIEQPERIFPFFFMSHKVQRYFLSPKERVINFLISPPFFIQNLFKDP